jgi:hypothetical protein
VLSKRNGADACRSPDHFYVSELADGEKLQGASCLAVNDVRRCLRHGNCSRHPRVQRTNCIAVGSHRGRESVIKVLRVPTTNANITVRAAADGPARLRCLRVLERAAHGQLVSARLVCGHVLVRAAAWRAVRRAAHACSTRYDDRLFCASLNGKVHLYRFSPELGAHSAARPARRACWAALIHGAPAVGAEPTTRESYLVNTFSHPGAEVPSVVAPGKLSYA